MPRYPLTATTTRVPDPKNRPASLRTAQDRESPVPHDRSTSTRIRPILAASLVAGASLLAAGGLVAPVSAQSSSSQPSTKTLVEDFVFFMTVANHELAAANLRALLDQGIDPQELVAVIEDSPGLSARFDEAYRRALVVPELEADAAALWQFYEEGRRETARNPQRIAESIAMLDDTMRAQQLAAERLISANEYAVPQLYALLSGTQDLRMRARSQRMLERMGSAAVKPLLAALPSAPAEVQERIAMVLGQIGNPLALPGLYELSSASGAAPAARAEAINAIRAITGTHDTGISAAALYLNQARSYFDSRRREVGGLLSFPAEDFQLLWQYDPQIGLLPLPIETVVYHETMAMIAAEKALSLDPNNSGALAVWLASNFARELAETGQTPNPAYDSEDRDAAFFATLAGAGPTQAALQLALDDGDTQLARAIIAALDRSIGGEGLIAGEGSQTALVKALTYPDRQTRFEAALALARSAPKSPFIGSERVVPTLAGFIRDGGTRFALVIAEDADRQQFLRSALEADGFTVLPPRRNLNETLHDVAETPGIDLVLIDQPGDLGVQTMESLRNQPSLRTTPALLFLSLQDQARFNPTVSADSITQMVRPGLDAAQVAEAARQAVEAASGELLDADTAEALALEALNTLRDLAISNNSALSITDAGTGLIAALGESSGIIKLELADVLGYICEKRAQVALLDAALEASDSEQTLLLRTVAASARRCGPLAEPRQISALADLLPGADRALANGVAEVLGALQATGQQAVPVILSK